MIQNKELVILIFIILLVIIYFFMFILIHQGVKLLLQHLITKNYNLRVHHKLPDKWYWVDLIYFEFYGDYSFYKEPTN